MREPLHQAKAALRAANRALERMKAARDIEEFEDAWQDYLGSLEKSWVKVERSCQAYRNQFQPWQGKFARRRKKDPLLRYLKHARHADEHTIEEIIERVPGYRTLNPAYGKSWHIEHLEIRDGDMVSYSEEISLLWYRIFRTTWSFDVLRNLVPGTTLLLSTWVRRSIGETQSVLRSWAYVSTPISSNKRRRSSLLSR